MVIKCISCSLFVDMRDFKVVWLGVVGDVILRVLVRVLFPGSRESKPRLKAGKQSCSGADCFPIGYRSGLNQWFCGCMWPLYRSQWFC